MKKGCAERSEASQLSKAHADTPAGRRDGRSYGVVDSISACGADDPRSTRGRSIAAFFSKKRLAKKLLVIGKRPAETAFGITFFRKKVSEKRGDWTFLEKRLAKKLSEKVGENGVLRAQTSFEKSLPADYNPPVANAFPFFSFAFL